MVWVGISLNLTAERYVEEVVQNHNFPFAHEIGPDFVLMQGGDRAHTSRVTTRFLEDSGIQVMDWPPRSPDLNCIEHLWDLIGRRLHNRQHQSQTNTSGIGRCIVGRMEGHSSRNHPQANQKHVMAVSSCHLCQGR